MNIHDRRFLGRFWGKIDRPSEVGEVHGGGDACWNWTAGTCQGYGRIKLSSAGVVTYLDAHRVSYALAKGDIPAGQCVMHSCDNRRCCNPKHLSLGTVGQNNADRDAKGRCVRARGERAANARLSEAQVREIRQRVASGETKSGVARTFGVTSHNVRAIVARKSWRHVT
jgi:hypothetical protein